jgi:hypothetical protein
MGRASRPGAGTYQDGSSGKNDPKDTGIFGYDSPLDVGFVS